jgi:hypothetical protein
MDTTDGLQRGLDRGDWQADHGASGRRNTRKNFQCPWPSG